MRYYAMESPSHMKLPPVTKSSGFEIVAAKSIDRFEEVDYAARGAIISNRLKLVMEMYLPKYDFEPVVFVKEGTNDMIEFWRFDPPIFKECDAEYRNDDIVSRISFLSDEVEIPFIFTVTSPKGIKTIVMDMSAVNSILRRCISSIKFTKIL